MTSGGLVQAKPFYDLYISYIQDVHLSVVYRELEFFSQKGTDVVVNPINLLLLTFA